MDIVGCEDDYKIDLSVYNGPLNKVFEKLKVFPKEYFSTAKTFSFDRDIIEEKFTGGCSDKLIQYLEYSIEKLFYIYDLNPNLIDKNFEVDKVIFNDVRYNNNGLFDLKFYYKDFHDMDIKNVPISNFLKKFKIEDIYRPFGKDIGYNEFVCSFICSPYHSFKFSFNVEKFDVSLLKNIEIKRKRTVFWNNGIDYDEGDTFWYSRMWGVVDAFIENLIFLQDLKDCNLINVKKADIDFGEDGNSLNLNGHDLLKFKFATRSQCNPFFIKDVYHTLSKLFRIFEVDCSVELENYHIKLTKDGESHLYELNGYSNSNLKKA